MGDYRRVSRYDSFVVESRPRKNYGPVRWLSLDGGGSNEKYAYIGFNLKDAGIVQNGITIISAQLKVYLYEAWAGGPHTVTAKRITQKWKESKITWNNKPNVSAVNAATDSITGGSTGDELLFNVTNIVSQAAAGAAYHGFRLELDTTGTKRVRSGESLRDQQRPVLEVVYQINPDPPFDLRPNLEEASISPANPVFSWTFNTDDPEESQGQSRVIIYDDEALTNDIYDSGWEVNTETEWDSSLDAGPPNLADDTQYWWTVAVRDSSGNESLPSDAASFWRDVPPTLDITFPAADNDNVDTTTPLITWNLSETQVRWRGFLDEKLPGKRWHRLTESSDVTADEEWQIEAGWIRYEQSEADYRVTIRAWEAPEVLEGRVRVAIVGAPSYSEDIRIFQYEPDETPLAPEDLLVTHSGAALVLTWHRDDIPDEFIITANGVAKTVLEPADVALGGGDYEYRTYNYDPTANITWRVRAVVDDQTSAASTYTLQNDLAGAWLVDIDDEVELFLAGRAKFSTQIGEAGNTFFPIGRRAPVRIVDSIRGMEGTLQGQIVTYDGTDAETWYDRAIEIKSRAPGTVFRLIYGRHNFPVVIGELGLDQDAGPEHRHDVSIPFWQVGDFDIDVEG